jgi:hypothetical protein
MMGNGRNSGSSAGSGSNTGNNSSNNAAGVHPPLPPIPNPFNQGGSGPSASDLTELNLGIRNRDDKAFGLAATATITGGDKAVGVTLGNSDKPFLATATVQSGGAPFGVKVEPVPVDFSLKTAVEIKPVHASISGGDKALQLDVRPQRVKPDITLTFRLFGFRICSLTITGSAELSALN